ncbi:MAG: esterase [Elusimicrobia bacterium]|nr:esterase [Elusimicrobiota bacterium]
MTESSKPQVRRIGPLKAIEFPAPEASPTIVCLHGYGANCADLASLALELELPVQARWIFPDAPLEIPFAEGGRAWFPLDEAKIARAHMEGKPVDLSDGRPAGLDAAAEALDEFLRALAAPWETTVIGGFSQGAMMSVEAALRTATNPLGLFILSGTLVDEAGLKKRAAARKGLAFFQSHGRQDPLLGFPHAKALHDLLIGAGLTGELSAFDGGHGVAPSTIAALAGYLKGRESAG